MPQHKEEYRLSFRDYISQAFVDRAKIFSLSQNLTIYADVYIPLGFI